MTTKFGLTFCSINTWLQRVKKTNSNNCRWEKSPQRFVSWPISLSGGLDFQIKGVSFLRWLICLFAKYKTLEEGINRFSVAEVNFSSRRHLTPNLPDTGSQASTSNATLFCHFTFTFAFLGLILKLLSHWIHLTIDVEHLINVRTWEARLFL